MSLLRALRLVEGEGDFVAHEGTRAPPVVHLLFAAASSADAVAITVAVDIAVDVAVFRRRRCCIKRDS